MTPLPSHLLLACLTYGVRPAAVWILTLALPQRLAQQHVTLLEDGRTPRSKDRIEGRQRLDVCSWGRVL